MSSSQVIWHLGTLCGADDMNEVLGEAQRRIWRIFSRMDGPVLEPIMLLMLRLQRSR